MTMKYGFGGEQVIVIQLVQFQLLSNCYNDCLIVTCNVFKECLKVSIASLGSPHCTLALICPSLIVTTICIPACQCATSTILAYQHTQQSPQSIRASSRSTTLQHHNTTIEQRTRFVFVQLVTILCKWDILGYLSTISQGYIFGVRWKPSCPTLT